MSHGHVLVAGASGLVGRAAIEVFAEAPDWEVVGLSRRSPGIPGTRHRAVDLLDPDACRVALGTPNEDEPITHLVYCALQERAGLVGGWRNHALMEINRQMLDNVLDALTPTESLVHVSLLQGAKAYGVHLHPMRIPGRERETRDAHENFYWLQEDLLRERAGRAGFHFTIWRPPVVFGHAVGSPMNPLAAIALFAALSKAEGRPLQWPGGRTGPQDGVDARLLARALLWAAQAAEARNQVFNVTNGDVFRWEHLFEGVAQAMDMDLAEPAPQRLSETLPKKAARWSRLVAEQDLQAPGLVEWLGDSGVYVDLLFNAGRDEPPPAALLSTIKLRQAGFHDCIDTEDMLVEWLERLRSRRILPT